MCRNVLIFNTNKVQKTCDLLVNLQHGSLPEIFTQYLYETNYLRIFIKYTIEKSTSFLTNVLNMGQLHMKSHPRVTRCRVLGQSGPVLHDSLGLSFPCNLLGALQQSVVDVFCTGDLRLDHAEVLRIGHRLCLDCVWLGGCWDQVG